MRQAEGVNIQNEIVGIHAECVSNENGTFEFVVAAIKTQPVEFETFALSQRSVFSIRRRSYVNDLLSNYILPYYISLLCYAFPLHHLHLHVSPLRRMQMAKL